MPEQADTASAAMPDEVATAPDAAPPAPPKADASKVDRSHAGEVAPAAGFTSPDGTAVTLADFKGKPVLLNLWATWCAPCVAELPTLDAMAAQQGTALRVLTVSQDLDGKAKVVPFLQKAGVERLPAFTDPKLALSLAFQANLPTTILFDAAGRELWRVTGGMDWTSDKAQRLIAEAR